MRSTYRFLACLAHLAIFSLPAAMECPAREPAASSATGTSHGRKVNLVTDFGGAVTSSDIAEPLQKAVDEVGAAGGGTIVIPANQVEWHLSAPIFVGYPNVTIEGEGAGTRLSGDGGNVFLLGMKPQYDPPITAGHFFPVGGAAGWLDSSVAQVHFGLRTFDGTTPASGCFLACPLALGGKVPRDPSGIDWKDYAKGSGKPTYWADGGQYTFNLAVINHTGRPMAGVLCGVGPGGPTPGTTRGDVTDPLNIWTIESDPANGKDLCFRFKVVDADGRESIQSLPLARNGAMRGLHRISVQLDFATGKCRSWYGESAGEPAAPGLSGKLDLPAGLRLKAFQYGAFRLGRVVSNPFDGSPATGNGAGDWTYCGLSLFEVPRYLVEGAADQAGAVQQTASGKIADDAYRYFPATSEKGLLTFLPLAGKIPRVGVPFQNGRTFNEGRGGLGYWMPSRAIAPLGGTIAVRQMRIGGAGTPILIGEAQHVLLEDVRSLGGCLQTVGNLNCGLTGGLLEMRNCRVTGRDSAVYCHSMTIHATSLSGGGGELSFRLVGCRGYVDQFLVTGFVRADYYVKIHAGAVGGPLRFGHFCIDNEGMDCVPLKAVFYAEPSLDGGPLGNSLHLAGVLYTGAMETNKAVVELAEAPWSAPAATSKLLIDGIDAMFPAHKLDTLVLVRSPNWGGTVRAQSQWSEHFANGLVQYTTRRHADIVTLQESSALPTQGTWVEGSNLVRIPQRPDAASGAWIFKTYRCSRSGVYGSKAEPQWQEVNR